MSTATSVYGFEKPSTSDYYDITKFNATLDDIDALLGASVKFSKGHYTGTGVAGLGNPLMEIPIKKGAVPLRLEIMRSDAEGANLVPAPSGNVGGISRSIQFAGLSETFEIVTLLPIYMSSGVLKAWEGNTLIRRKVESTGTVDYIEFYVAKPGAAAEELVHYQMNVLNKYYYWTLYYIDGDQL